MLPISSSPRAFCFEDLRPAERDQLLVLDASECANTWNAFTDARARNLNELPGDHWLNAVVWRNIGNWLAPYNDETKHPDFIRPIEVETGWTPAQVLFLIQNRKNILTFPWQAFTQCWRGLLCAFDDGPLLVPANGVSGSVVCFAPLGNVQHAIRSG